MRNKLAAAAAAVAAIVLTAPSAQAVTARSRTLADPMGDVTHCKGATAAQKSAADLRGLRVRIDPAHPKVAGINLVLADLPPKSRAYGGRYYIELTADNYLVIEVGRGATLSVLWGWPDYTGGYTETPQHPASATYNGTSNQIHIALPLRDTITRVDDWVGTEAGWRPFCADAMPRLSIRVHTA